MNARQVQMYFSIKEYIICFFRIDIIWILEKPQKGIRSDMPIQMISINWKREDAKAGMVKSDVGWDSESVSYPTCF